MLEFFLGNPKEKAAIQKSRDLEQKANPTKKEQADQLSGKRIYAKLIRRRVGGALAVLAISSMAGLGAYNFYLDQVFFDGLPSWLKVEDINKIGREWAKQSALAAIEWDNKLHCERDITIRYLEDPYSRDLGNGVIAQQDESAIPGVINLPSHSEPRRNILHGMTHACQPGGLVTIDPPLPISVGEVIGYQGLRLKIRVPSTTVSKAFDLFEEGMAERNASSFEGYSSSNPAYAAMSRVTTRAFPITPDSSAHNWAKNNDVNSFVSTKLGLLGNPPITGPQLEVVMTEYQQAWSKGMAELGVR